MIRKRYGILSFAASCLAAAVLIAPAAFPQNVTYKPYIQPGDNAHSAPKIKSS